MEAPANQTAPYHEVNDDQRAVPLEVCGVGNHIHGLRNGIPPDKARCHEYACRTKVVLAMGGVKLS